MALASVGILTELLKTGTSAAQGFGFGTGYGAGVRFGYTDVYPALREALARIPFFGAGFNGAIEQKMKTQPLRLPSWFTK